VFNNAIHSTTLTSEAADNLFSNITASTAPDQSFLSTLRALLHKRLPQNETATLTCKRIHRSAQEISFATAADCMSWFMPTELRYPCLTEHGIYIVFASQPDAGAKMLEIIKANAGNGKRYMSDYTRRDDLRVFFARKVNALFYTDASEQNTVIFVDKLELKQFHVLQMMIPKYLPQLFKDSPLSSEEIKLLKSTGNKNSIEYEMLIEEFSKTLDIRAEIIRSKLAGFETGFERMRLDELKNEISVCQNEYDLYLSKMREAADKIQERKYTLAGLECAISKHSGDSELMEYFMCNKNLTITEVAGTKITFIAHGYADIYDEEAFEAYVSNHDGYFYEELSPRVTAEEMEKLYRAIFSEGKYKLRICAAYTADIRNGLKAFRDYIFPQESRTYFPNPHIQVSGCIGNYAGRFQEYLQKRDYVGAIDQATVSARNLNFYDSTVIKSFARDFSRTTIKCVEAPDGTLLTPREAIKEREGGNHAATDNHDGGNEDASTERF
jgi:hypothetical protein